MGCRLRGNDADRPTGGWPYAVQVAPPRLCARSWHRDYSHRSADCSRAAGAAGALDHPAAAGAEHHLVAGTVWHLVADPAHQLLRRGQKRLGVTDKHGADLRVALGIRKLFGRLDDAFVVIHRLRDRGEVWLRRVLRAQHALGVDYQRLDMVARLAAFAALDLGEPLRRAFVIDGFDAVAQLLVGARERIPRGDETAMQGLALGHPVVLVVLLGIIIVGLLEQWLELGHGFHVGRGGGFELSVARLEGICLLDILATIRRIIDGVGAVDDALLAGGTVLADPAEIART